MANKLDPMDLKQIISLHLDKYSNRKIAETLSIGRNTVNQYIAAIKACGVDLQELRTLENASLCELFPTQTTINNERYDTLMKYFEEMKHSRHHPGFTFQFHYIEYKQQVDNAYGYTQFMAHYNRKYKKEKGSMKLEHQAGHEMFIDYAGKKLHYVDKQTGEEIPVEVFVAILPCSQYTYVEACPSQKKEDLIASTGHALSFYAGVPKAIVSDNLKSAVSRASKYEADINRSFKDFANHYSCVVNPTRSYSPQDKALVENAVNLAYQRIYYPLRNMIFFSIEDLNKEIRSLLEKYNDMLFLRKQASRKELFQSVERGYLKDLPSTGYQLKEYKRAKVQKMGYVYFSPDKSYYSVPYRYIGKSTQLHYTTNTVEVYFNNDRIASHHRNKVSGTYVTNKEHLSSSHKAYSNWSVDYFRKLASKHGSSVEAYVVGMINQHNYPEINYKRAMGLIQLHKSYGSDRLNKACERALYGESFSYNMVKNILKNKLDEQVLDIEKLEDKESHIPQHDNVRGASAYQ
jgi:transposase